MSMGTRGAMKTAWSIPSAAVRSFESATLNESIDIINCLSLEETKSFRKAMEGFMGTEMLSE